MSIEFRLKYIRDVIDKNINEVLLKWNAKKVLLDEPFDEERKEMCLACLETGQQRYLQYFYVNMDEAVYKCENSACLFPFRNFKYKNYTDRTIFRYERTVTKDASKAEHKMFSSPTKEESVDLGDDFNLSWLDQSLNTDSDLDAILTSPSDGTTCDIKEIINDICNNVNTSSLGFNSPSNRSIEQSPKAPAAKLSKCIKYIEHLSPSKRSLSNKIEILPPPMQVSKTSSTVSESASMFSKSRKKIRKVVKKNRDTKPAKCLIVDQQPLKSLDWLSMISKIEPENIHEFEFTSPTQVIEDRKNNLPKNIEYSSEASNIQPILIEFMGTSTSFVLDGNQLPTEGELCLSYQKDKPQTETITLPAKRDISSEKPISTIISSTNILSSDTTSNAKHSTNIKMESHLDFDVNKAEPQTVKHPLKQEDGIIEDQYQEQTETQQNIDRLSIPEIKTGEIKLEQTKNETKISLKKYLKEQQKKQKKEERKIEQKKKAQQRRDELKQKKIMEQGKRKMELNRKSFNIESEEIFFGFEPLEPFKSTSLQRKYQMWLKTE